jgi:hypothetical protein
MIIGQPIIRQLYNKSIELLMLEKEENKEEKVEKEEIEDEGGEDEKKKR